MDLVPGLLAMQMSRVFTVSENQKMLIDFPKIIYLQKLDLYKSNRIFAILAYQRILTTA